MTVVLQYGMTATRVSLRIRIGHDGQVSKHVGPDGIRHGAEENKQSRNIFLMQYFILNT